MTLTGGQVTGGNLNLIPGFVDYTAAVTEIGKPFDPKLTNSYTNASPMTVYDSLGNSHQVMQYFVKRPADAAGNSVYEVYYSIDGQAMAPTTQAGGVWGNPTQFTFNKAGVMTSATTVNLTFANPGGATTPANPLNIAINYTGTTQYGSPYAFKGTGRLYLGRVPRHQHQPGRQLDGRLHQWPERQRRHHRAG